MIAKTKATKQVAANIRAHDRIAKSYEKAHGEIYNKTEQARLRGALEEAIACITTGSTKKSVLDFGCGAGNLTSHLSCLGCDVVASDVSKICLDLVLSRDYDSRVEALLLNGVNLSNIEDHSLDMVATYSVLHHVPDYLGILPEFVRVLKPGGVIFIDHEVSDEYWNPTAERKQFLSEIALPVKKRWRRFLQPTNYINWFMLRFVDPRYRPEGDIHVFEDDHIEWEKVSSILIENGAAIVKECKYLLFREGYDPEIYDRYARKISDTQYLIARKHSGTSR